MRVSTVDDVDELIEQCENVGFEPVAKYVTLEFAYVEEIEWAKLEVGEREGLAPSALRVTRIFRPEEGTWKVVSRHADPITSPGPAESVYRSRATARGLLGQIGLLITSFQGRAV